MSDLFGGILPFVRVAEERSFGRAAAGLGITTAAVSKAIKKLEDELGVKLLERSSRVVRLTPEGVGFFERCRPAVLSVQGARDAVLGTRREPRGEISVTLSFVLAPFVVPALPRLAAQYPRLGFRVSLSDRLARLAAESYDVAIRLGELADSSLVSRRLRSTRWVTVASPGYLARCAPPKTVGDLSQHNCLRFVDPAGKPRELVFAGGAAVKTGGNLLIDNGLQLLEAAKAGMGVCQVLDFMADAPLREGSLIELLPAFSAEGPSVHALMTQARAGSANVRAFMRFLVDAFR
jgi:DNA-binding transcriptional LysR family regulator